MPTKLTKQTLKVAGRLGFEFVWNSGDGFMCYVHPDDPDQTEVSISPSINSEHHAKVLVRRMEKIVGVAPKIEKRKGSQVKERDAAERDRAQQRLAWAEAKRQRLIADRAEADHLAKIDELIEVRRSELRALHAQMSSSPQGSQHHGRGRVEYATTSSERNPL